MAGEGGLPLVILRPGGIYGPGDPRFVKLVRPIARRRFVMIGSGVVRWHPVFIDDLVQAYLLAGERVAAAGEAFLIGGPELVWVKKLVRTIALILGVAPPRLRVPAAPLYGAAWLCEKVCAMIGVEPPLHRRRLGFFLKDRLLRLDKARRLLGYEPAVGVEDGFRATIAWYREQGYL